MIMETNMSVMGSLHAFYDDLCSVNNQVFGTKNCQDEFLRFSSQIREMMDDLKMHISRGRVLVKIGDDRKALVRLLQRCGSDVGSDFAQVQHHMQDHATRKMERLTEDMQKLSENGQREAVIMRIITFITLVYLPATFVSVRLRLVSPRHVTDNVKTFFSTDIVKYQNVGAEAQDSFSLIALYRWLQVTLPLTALTIGAAVYMIWKNDRNS
jgi:hypothetical protein